MSNLRPDTRQNNPCVARCDVSLRLQEQVYLAIGRVSMCWNTIPSGIFDDQQAIAIGKQLIQDIACELNRQQADEIPTGHDGDLDGYKVKYGSEWHIQGIRIQSSDPSVVGNDMFLVPHRALSLRDWLIQETPTLERMAKEQ